MLNIESYITLLKRYAKNPSESMEDFARSFLDTYVKAGNILNKKGYLYDFDKTRISRLLNHKDDIPSAFREALDDETMKRNMEKSFPKTIEIELNMLKMSKIIEELSELISSDENLSEEEKRDLLKNDSCYEDFLLFTFLKTISINNKQPKAKENILFSRGKYSVEFVKGDLFKYAYDSRNKKKRIIVIPVNTTFDTYLSSRLSNGSQLAVSEETLHGKLLSRLLALGYKEEEIQKMIYSDLDSKDISYDESEGKREYPVGTIATLDFDNKVFFLLAISRFDEFNMARSTLSDIKTAVNCLIDYYDRFGQGYKVFIPLLGTGRSRANLTSVEAYNVITEILSKRIQDIHGNIILVALPEAYAEIKKGDND